MNKPNPNFKTSLGTPHEQALARLQMAATQASAAAAVAAVTPDTVPPMDQGMPFEIVSLDLTGADPNVGISAAKPFNYDRGGYGLYFRRRGSHAMASLAVRAGGTFQFFHPGDRIVGPFNNLEIDLNSISLPYGKAELVIEKRKDCHFIESDAQRWQVDTLFDQTFTAQAAGGGFTSPTLDITAYESIRLEVPSGIVLAGGAAPTTTARIGEILADGSGGGFTTVAGMAAAGASTVQEMGANIANGAVLSRAEWQNANTLVPRVTVQLIFAGSPTTFSGRLILTGYHR